MRIRKKHGPFPLSTLSPVPLSDPHHLINRSPVLVQFNDAVIPATKKSSSIPVVLLQHASAPASSRLDPPQPSDQPIGKPSRGWDDPSGGIGVAPESGAPSQHNNQHRLEEDGREQVGGEKANDTRKGGILGSEIPVEVFLSSSPSSNQDIADGRWCEGEKAIPFKKRRGSFDNATVNNTDNVVNNNKKMKTRMKTKMNKKCSAQNDNNMEPEDAEDEGRETKLGLNVTKKRPRGSALMEGSRCSRVNGRGWRCCQQTLVGYSLCEHHLGKGRLRSMTSVRSRSVATTTAPKKLHEHDLSESLSGASSSFPEEQANCVTDPLDSDEKKPLIISKKRMKLGMVKARSISSLLGQTNTEIAEAHENNK